MAVRSDINRKHATGLVRPLSAVLIGLIFIILIISGFSGSTGAFNFQEIAAFTNALVGSTAPANPAGGLIQGTDGNFYGTSFAGGDFGLGTVFQMTSNGVVTVLASFNGTNGANPRGTMVTDNAGNFYGVTYGGGINTNEKRNRFSKFPYAEREPDGSCTTSTQDPALRGNPYAGLLRGMDGKFSMSARRRATAWFSKSLRLEFSPI